eukprot:502328-Pleurochrysis_carterae.AAC.2
MFPWVLSLRTATTCVKRGTHSHCMCSLLVPSGRIWRFFARTTVAVRTGGADVATPHRALRRPRRGLSRTEATIPLTQQVSCFSSKDSSF